jgi:hypothetical protein
MFKPMLMLLLAGSLSQTSFVLAAEPQPYTLTYKANFEGVDTDMVRSLAHAAGSDDWEMKSSASVKMLGATVISVEETSNFGWHNELPVAKKYSYVQGGLSKRKRQLEFAEDGKSANYSVNDKSGTLTLTPPVYDAFNSALVLRAQLLAGKTDISFSVADKTDVTVQKYRVAGKESITTPAGTFNTVHVQRVREGDSKRTTDLWLALDNDYVLVKSLQVEPDGSNISMQLKAGL